MKTKTQINKKNGFSSVMAMIFVTLFSILAISFAAMTDLNVQMSRNHRDISQAQAAAESGLQFVNHLIANYAPQGQSAKNTVTDTEAIETFAYFADYVDTYLDGSPLLQGAGTAWDGSALTLQVPASGAISLSSDTMGRFKLVFSFEPVQENIPPFLVATCIGQSGDLSRAVRMKYPIKKDTKVLEYAMAGRGRMWVTGDSTIEGDIFSTWDRPDISPFNITSDSSVLGSINTIMDLDQILPQSWQLETLDENNEPMFDTDGNRIYSPEDEVQGYHEGVNYGQEENDMPGLDIDDYDTSEYRDMVTSLPASAQIQTEYFPHAPGDYTLPKPGYSDYVVQYYHMEVDRHVYENMTITDAMLPAERNALFRNCTFEGVLFVESGEYGGTYNNVRFEDCTFNGPIVTDVPQPFNWIRNCLYFTGAAAFNNQAMEEATILAPHFNVNLGNTDPGVVQDGESTLTGAIVGGIVDIRGNAEINGTIISMFDAGNYTSGYVTNIGATMGDGGSETTEPGDVGVIHIKPDPNRLLPSGMVTPIIIGSPEGDTYVELSWSECGM